MNDLETQIMDISDDALDELFNETPEKTVNADTLIGGKKNITNSDDDDEDEETLVKPKKEKQKAVPVSQSVIENIDLDAVEDDIDDDDDEDDEKEKKSTKRAAKLEAEEAAKKVAEQDTKQTEGSEGVSSILKSTVEYLIQEGLWQDFDGREELDITEETYAKLVAEQDKLRVSSMFNELVDSTGPFGKAIIDYVKNGGNPDEIIDLFKEQKQIDSISTDKPEGQKELVKHYFTEVMGWKPEKVEKYISNLVLSNELENEAAEVKDLFSSYYKKEAEKLNQEREAFAAQQREAEIAFENNMRNTIRERKDLSASEKKLYEDYVLNYDQRLPDGNMVNKFYLKFAKLQSNPADYIDLVAFVMDKDKFVQKVATTEKSKATAEAFKFIKGNGAVSTKKGTSHEQIKRNEKVSSFDWGIPSK